MIKIERFKRELLLLLIVGILIVCIGFIISCGKGPQQKVVNSSAGQFAVNFNDCPVEVCQIFLDSDLFKTDDNKKVANKELTFEAWVKSKSTSTSAFTGPIAGRFDSGGIALYVEGGVPKAVLRRTVATGTATATADYIVSGNQIADKLWHHIAGVLVNSTHTHTSSPTCTLAAAAEAPHLDIYVDGEFEGCASTFGASNDPATEPAFADEPGGQLVGVGTFSEIAITIDGTLSMQDVKFPGVIDEVRLWGVARTESEITACMDQELGFNKGRCGLLTDNLIAYLRFNEGKGASVNDFAGHGTAVREYSNPSAPPPTLDWLTGWTTGAPLTRD